VKRGCLRRDAALDTAESAPLCEDRLSKKSRGEGGHGLGFRSWSGSGRIMFAPIVCFDGLADGGRGIEVPQESRAGIRAGVRDLGVGGDTMALA